MMDIQTSETMIQKMGITFQSKPETFYHPPYMWLLGTTSGNQEQIMMDISRSETFIQPK